MAAWIRILDCAAKIDRHDAGFLNPHGSSPKLYYSKAFCIICRENASLVRQEDRKLIMAMRQLDMMRSCDTLPPKYRETNKMQVCQWKAGSNRKGERSINLSYANRIIISRFSTFHATSKWKMIGAEMCNKTSIYHAPGINLTKRRSQRSGYLTRQQ
jgi:hypothetical protein